MVYVEWLEKRYQYTRKKKGKNQRYFPIHTQTHTQTHTHIRSASIAQCVISEKFMSFSPSAIRSRFSNVYPSFIFFHPQATLVALSMRFNFADPDSFFFFVFSLLGLSLVRTRAYYMQNDNLIEIEGTKRKTTTIFHCDNAHSIHVFCIQKR